MKMEGIALQEMLNTTIGAQLIALGDCGFTVRTMDNQYLDFEFTPMCDDYGAENDIATKLYFDPNDKKNAPIITNVIYNKEEADNYDHVLITFFGLNKTLAQIDSYSNGDGYYCCAVLLDCLPIRKYSIITSTC